MIHKFLSKVDGLCLWHSVGQALFLVTHFWLFIISSCLTRQLSFCLPIWWYLFLVSSTLAALAFSLISADAFMEVHREEHNYIYYMNFPSQLLILTWFGGFILFYFKVRKHTWVTWTTELEQLLYKNVKQMNWNVSFSRLFPNANHSMRYVCWEILDRTLFFHILWCAQRCLSLRMQLLSVFRVWGEEVVSSFVVFICLFVFIGVVMLMFSEVFWFCLGFVC